jgi:hypothetical protein
LLIEFAGRTRATGKQPNKTKYDPLLYAHPSDGTSVPQN